MHLLPFRTQLPRLLLGVCIAAAIVGCDRNSGVSGPTVEPEEPELPPPPSDQRATVAFYNVENLFDASDDPDNEGDDEFLPTAAKRWTAERYEEKLTLLTRVLTDLGTEAGTGYPAIVGLAEVENRGVVADLAGALSDAGADYDFVHYESPDFRGIDNALLFRPDEFAPLYTRAVNVSLPPREGSTRRRTTRDILYVKGLLRGDTLHYLVNHWPSRGGGETASRPGRIYVAEIVRALVDSITAVTPAADVVVAGDLNDDPDDESVARVLGSAPRRDLASAELLYNPYVALHLRGEGTLGYQRAWNLFDQLIFTVGMADHGADWSVREAQIFAPGYLLQSSGSYAGFPDRTYVGDDYRGGASDHLPVYAVLQRTP